MSARRLRPSARMTYQGPDGSVDFRPPLWELTGVRAGDVTVAVVQVLAGGAPFDLTGRVLTAQARQTEIDPDPPALTGTITPLDLVAGLFYLGWDGDEVRAVLGPDGHWLGRWDIQMDGKTIVAGPIYCEGDVTR